MKDNVTATYRDGVRDALAAAAREVERNTAASPAALASAIRMMGAAGPLAADGPVQVKNIGYLRDRILDIIHTEMTEPVDPEGDSLGARADVAAQYVGDAFQDELDRRKVDACDAHKARTRELEAGAGRCDRIIRDLNATIIRHGEADDAEAVRRHARIAELEEQLAAARSVADTWEHRVRYGDSAVLPLIRDIRSVLCPRPAAPTTTDRSTPPQGVLMSDTDLLRRAAQVARETANAATDGPWQDHDTHLDYGGHTATILTKREELTDTGLIGWLPTFSHEPWDEKTNAWANADHVALWHPGIARLVADMLACAADLDLSERETVARERCGMCGIAHLTEIARVLLGEA